MIRSETTAIKDLGVFVMAVRSFRLEDQNYRSAGFDSPEVTVNRVCQPLGLDRLSSPLNQAYTDDDDEHPDYLSQCEPFTQKPTSQEHRP